MSLAKLVACKTSSVLKLTEHGTTKNAHLGELHVTSEELNASREMVNLTLGGRHLDKKDLFGKR